MTGIESAAPAAGAGLRPAFAAVRAQLGLVARALRTRRRRLVVDRRADAGHGRGALDRSGDVRLVPRRLGRDDGGDDVPVGRSDGRAVLAHEQEVAAGAARVHRGLPLTWAGAGVVAFLVGLASTARPATPWRGSTRGAPVAGATLIVAAVYELTPLKDVCLGKCRSPLGFLLGSWRDGWSGALRMGAKNGAWCVGCCWALMASLFALGVMSVTWMAVVAGLIAAREDPSVAPHCDLWHGAGPSCTRRARDRRTGRPAGFHHSGEPAPRTRYGTHGLMTRVRS